MGDVILVVAGNHQQFQYWHHQAGRPANWRYAWDTRVCCGLSRDTPVFLVGQWWLSSVNIGEIHARFRNVHKWRGIPVAPIGTPPTTRVDRANVIPLMHRSLVGGFKIKRRTQK